VLISIDDFTAQLACADPAADRDSASATGDAALVVSAQATADAQRDVTCALARAWRTVHETAVALVAPPPATWPFRNPLVPELPEGPVLVWAPGLDEAFANAQTGGVRLVTTQPAFLLATWRAALLSHGRARLVATANPTRLRARAPEAPAGRGPWRDVAILLQDGAPEAATPESNDAQGTLPRAFRTDDPVARLRLCLEALAAGRDAATLVASGSASVEAGDMDNAERLLLEAAEAAPSWAAPAYELGKLWLRRDDMDRAARWFDTAARLLPCFAPAAANLGATLGELGRTDEALAAFEQARTADPDSDQVLNNLGVLYRETGRLAESETVFRRLIRLVPDLAFGHYNLGHTLFLQGRYQAAVLAYREGQARDATRNPVQASRLALAQLAAGDGEAALAGLQRCTAGLPRDYRRQLLADTHAVVWALLTHRPDLPAWKPVTDWLSAELGRDT
jgi:Flp pilus assembly protein TadD